MTKFRDKKKYKNFPLSLVQVTLKWTNSKGMHENIKKYFLCIFSKTISKPLSTSIFQFEQSWGDRLGFHSNEPHCSAWLTWLSLGLGALCGQMVLILLATLSHKRDTLNDPFNEQAALQNVTRFDIPRFCWFSNRSWSDSAAPCPDVVTGQSEWIWFWTQHFLNILLIWMFNL